MLSKTLDVAIGICFLYLLVSMAASVIVELIATWRNWRGRMLREAIVEMFSRSAMVSPEEVFQDPLISTLSKRRRLPSYIPASSFSAAVIDVLLCKTAKATRPSDILNANPRDEGCHDRDPLRALLATTVAIRGDSFQAITFALEKWFNDSMARTSGFYKRHSQKWLFSLGLVFAAGCNINTVAAVQWLWKGDNARQAVVADAIAYIKANPTPPKDGAASSPKDGSQDKIKELASTYATLDKEFTKLDWPIGWNLELKPANVPPSPWAIAEVLQFLFGALLSAIAISLGSSFWFDSLQSLVKIRGTGPKP